MWAFAAALQMAATEPNGEDAGDGSQSRVSHGAKDGRGFSRKGAKNAEGRGVGSTLLFRSCAWFG